MSRPVNKSALMSLTISLPAQTHEYLIRLAKVGFGSSEQAIAARLVEKAVEELIEKKRARKRYLDDHS
jgi:hypothetical protein